MINLLYYHPILGNKIKPVQGFLLLFCVVMMQQNILAQTLNNKDKSKRNNTAKLVQVANNQGNKWNRKDYASVTHTNFRNNPVFKQKLDMQNLDYGLINATIFFATNEKRVEANLTPLDYAPELEIMAYHHALSMAKQDFFSHNNPKAKNRKDPEDRAKLAGIKNPFIAENIAMQYGSNYDNYLLLADAFLKQWMNSEGHKANILSDKGLQMGMGLMPKGEKIYAVQCFQWFKKIEKSNTAIDKLPN